MIDFDDLLRCYDCGSRLREDHVGDLCPTCAARYDENGRIKPQEAK